MGFWKKYKNRFLKGAVLTGLAAALAGAGATAYCRFPAEAEGTQRPADENYKQVAVNSASITAYVDWDQQDLKLVSSQKDDYFYISDSKMKTWEEIDAEQGVAYVDLSWITKEYELKVRGDKDINDIATINFRAPRTIKAKYTVENGEPKISLTVTETVDKKKVTTQVDPSNNSYVQWRKGTAGDWQPYEALDLQKYMTKGATLNLRLKGQAGADASSSYFPSKVASLKITKKTKAPSVKVDPEKLILGVKKGQEYMVITSSTRTAITQVTDKSQASPALKDIPAIEGDGYEKPIKAFSVKVRTAATEKKAASQWAVISYPEQRTTAENALTAVLAEDGKKVTLTNNTTYDIEYFVPETDLITTVRDAGITQKTKWSTVKAMKSASVNTKTKTIIISTNTPIFFRYAQEKDNTKTAENEAELASVVGIIKPTN